MTAPRPAKASVPARAGALLATLVLLLALAPAPIAPLSVARAQGLIGDGSGDGPLEIDAEDGIEWRRDEQVYIARGNASVRRGTVTVHGDRLVAHYREIETTGGGDTGGAGPTGDTEIYRLEAVGAVRIVDERATARGDKAVYDLDQQVVVLTGDDLRFETEQETITAEDTLEYWQARSLAVARGNAVAVREDRRIQAEVLAARFEPREGAGGSGAGGSDARAREITRIEAFEDVRVSTPEEFARGDRGVYNTRTEIATLTGNVRLTRGENQLNGGWGQVNLRTGVSRLLGAPPDSGEKRRVKALLEPGSAEDAKLSRTAEDEAAANDQGANGQGTDAQGGADAATGQDGRNEGNQ